MVEVSGIEEEVKWDEETGQGRTRHRNYKLYFSEGLFRSTG